MAEVVHGTAAAGTSALLGLPVVYAAALAAGTSLRLSALVAAVYFAVATSTGLCRPRSTIESQGVLWAGGPIVVGLVAGTALAGGLDPSVGISGLAAASAAAAVLLGLRIAAWLFVAAGRRRGLGLSQTLVSGPPLAVERVTRRLRAFPEAGLEVTAVCTAIGDSTESYDDALELIGRRAVDHVLVVAGALTVEDAGAELVLRGAGSGIAYSLVLPLSGFARSRPRHRIGDLGVLPIGNGSLASRARLAKRVFDSVAAAALLVLLAPLLAMTATLVALLEGRPVFFGQSRVGRGGRRFTIWKFRSMLPGADEMVEEHRDRNFNNGLLFKLEGDPRITRLGALLRRYSIDELPQLVNVMKGEMSFVGPRPLPVDPSAFDDIATKRHSVRPGITGPWQVQGGHALSYEDMIELDLAYIAGWSFRRDLWLLVRTIPALVIRRAPVL